MLNTLDRLNDVRLKTGDVAARREFDTHPVADHRQFAGLIFAFAFQRAATTGDSCFETHKIRNLRRSPLAALVAVEQELREGQPHRTAFLDRRVKERTRKEA